MSARLIRECLDLISASLALIFNQSVDSGIFPDESKNARITPLFKKAGSRSDPSNYRRYQLSRLWPRFSSESYMISCIIT